MLELFFFNFLNSISFAFIGSYRASFKRQLVLLLLFTFPLLFFLVNIKYKILVLYLFICTRTSVAYSNKGNRHDCIRVIKPSKCSAYRVSKKTHLKEMCDFLSLKMLPLALALIKTKIAIFLTQWSENTHFK